MATALNSARWRALPGAVALLWLVVATGAGRADDVTGALPPPDPTGEWLVAKGYATIRIANCDGRLWGIVASELRPNVDSKNPDPNLRSRPTLGMPVLLHMTRTQSNQWDGDIYNSQDGHTYDANISLVDPNTLKVEGCFLGFLCGGENWKRVTPRNTTTGALPHSLPPHDGRANSNPANDVCLAVFGPAWLSHQGRLK